MLIKFIMVKQIIICTNYFWKKKSYPEYYFHTCFYYSHRRIFLWSCRSCCSTLAWKQVAMMFLKNVLRNVRVNTRFVTGGMEGNHHHDLKLRRQKQLSQVLNKHTFGKRHSWEGGFIKCLLYLLNIPYKVKA